MNRENSSCTVVFSILQFDRSGKQFGSNILTRIQLSVKIKLKSLFVSDTNIDCSLRGVFLSLGSQTIYNNLECVLVISMGHFQYLTAPQLTSMGTPHFYFIIKVLI